MAETETKTSRSQLWKHQDAVNWLTEQGHITPKSSQAEVVAAFAANRNAYRKTDQYRTLVDGRAETTAAEKAAASAAKAATKAAAKAAEAKAPKAAAKETTKAPTKAATKAASKASSKASSKADSPFD
jgi:hypothetical protein